MFVRLLSILVFFSVATAALARDKPAGVNGAYAVTVAGYYHGTGTGTVSGNTVSVIVNITTDDGATGQLVASLIIDGNHCTGSGSVLDQQLTVSARMDNSGSASTPELRASRIMATFITANNRGGRIVANRTVAAPDDIAPGDGGGGDGGSDDDDRKTQSPGVALPPPPSPHHGDDDGRDDGGPGVDDLH